MRAVIFDVETTHNSALFDLALEAARSRAERRGEVDVDEETVRAEMSLSPVFGRIVAAGLLDVDFDEPVVLAHDDERELLQAFWHHVQGYDLYVTWNGLSFDLPWLTVRSLIQGVRPTVRISTARFRHPGESNHLDLFALLTDWRGNRSKHLKLDLSTVARALGVEPPEGDGAEVPRLVERGDWEAIKRHLESDLRATLGIWKALGEPGRANAEAGMEPVPMSVPF